MRVQVQRSAVVRWRWSSRGVAAVFAITAVLIAACSAFAIRAIRDQAHSVVVAPAGPGVIDDQPGGLGSIQPVVDVPVTLDPLIFRGGITVAQVSVLPGTHVTKGQKLLSLDAKALGVATTDLNLQLQQAQTALAQARADAASTQSQTQVAAHQARIDALNTVVANDRVRLSAAQSAADQNAMLAAQNDLARDQAQLAGEQAQRDQLNSQATGTAAASRSRVAQLQAQVGLQQQLNSLAIGQSRDIQAPIDGVVSAINVQAGLPADTSKPLIEIVDTSNVRVTAAFPIGAQPDVKVGAAAVLSFTAAPDVTLKGTVVSVVPTATSNGLSFKAIVDAPNTSDQRIQSGLLAYVRVQAQHQAVVMVPRVAVLNLDLEPTVFVVHDGRVQRRTVRAGAMDGDHVEILGGVAAGERCVLAGTQTLESGSRVRATNA